MFEKHFCKGCKWCEINSMMCYEEDSFIYENHIPCGKSSFKPKGEKPYWVKEVTINE